MVSHAIDKHIYIKSFSFDYYDSFCVSVLNKNMIRSYFYRVPGALCGEPQVSFYLEWFAYILVDVCHRTSMIGSFYVFV